MENQQVWVRDAQEGFIIGKFTDMVDGDALIVPLNPKYPQRSCPLDEVYPAGEYTKDVEDNCNFCFLFAQSISPYIHLKKFLDFTLRKINKNERNKSVPPLNIQYSFKSVILS